MRHSPLLLLLGIATGAIGPVWAQAPPAPKVAEHDVLKLDEGTWEGEMTVWPEGPSGPSVASPIKEVNTVVADGLWLLSDFTSESEGFRFMGHGQFGYDVQKKKYVGTWIDSMSTRIAPMEGTYDAAKKEMTMFGTSADPATGKELRTKSVSRTIDADHREFVMYEERDGEFRKFMEVKYQRQK